MSTIYNNKNINSQNTIIDIIRNSNPRECCIISLMDSTLFEILIFLNIFDKIVSMFPSHKLFLGLPSGFEFLKTLYTKNNLYFIAQPSYRFFANKFKIIIDITKTDITLSHVISNVNIFDNLQTKFLNNSFIITEPILLNCNTDEYSDIIGINFKSIYPNNISSVYDEVTKANIINELKQNGSFLQYIEYEYNSKAEYFKSDKIIKNTPMSNNTYNAKISNEFQYFRKIYNELITYRYFIGVEGLLSLLASMVLGSNKCIILSKNLFTLKTFPNIKTVDITNEYIPNSISNIIKYFLELEFKTNLGQN